MNVRSLFRPGYLLPLLALLITGCASQPRDYSALQTSNPRSILVIPPQNNSVDVNAPYIFLSTISLPLAEKGYYVFPVAVIDQFLKQNGLPTPAEMNNVPLEKLQQYIGADAILYVTIDDWGQQYQVLSSVARVSSKWRLVDGKTGALLWSGHAYAQKSSGNSGGGLAGALISAVAAQIVSAIDDPTPELSRTANLHTLYNPYEGLLPGPYLRAKLEANKQASQ